MTARLANPYTVHTMTNIESSDEELPEPGQMMPDNFCHQNVEIDPMHIVGDNTEHILHVLEHKNEYDYHTRGLIAQTLLRAFDRLFQQQSEADNDRWNTIHWHVYITETGVLEATSQDDQFYIYFQFFMSTEDARLMLRVHYDGPIFIDRIQDTRAG